MIVFSRCDGILLFISLLLDLPVKLNRGESDVDEQPKQPQRKKVRKEIDKTKMVELKYAYLDETENFSSHI